MTLSRYKEHTGYKDIHAYKFAKNEEDSKAEVYMKRYYNLMMRNQDAITMREKMTPEEKRNFKGVLSDKERSELKELSKWIQSYKSEQKKKFQSIIRFSQEETDIGHGKDNVVYSGKGASNFVEKYSAENYEPLPETLEYLQKKYQLLKKYLSPYIPESRFVLGERYTVFDHKKQDLQRNKRMAVITLQRKVEGKTFQQMTVDEKLRPAILSQLQDAHKRYICLKHLLQKTARAMHLSGETLDAKLDIGHLSKYDNMDIFDPNLIEKFNTPNIMFDEKKQELYFIDFDMNEWNEDKEKVFQRMMTDDAFAQFQELLK